jgi:putative ABC transport system ATP-binding protein
MEKSLLRYIWKTTRLQQLWILLIVAASMVPYFLALDLPRQIVNGPIQGSGFETPDERQKALQVSFDVPFLGHLEFFAGIELDRFEMLMTLSFAFLALVVVNGLFKLYINTYKGTLGERMLRRIRFELVDRVLRFPPKHFKRVKSAEIATMIKDEVEPLGGFTGDAFVQPALLGGQALTTLVFIIVQNVWLGMIAAAIVGVQVAIIPRMRKRLLELGRQRQLTARELSGRVSEIVDGIGAIHGNDTSNLERADIAWRLGRIFSIRYDLYQWKFLVKFINNFLAQVTPFLFYAVGGYFVLLGKLDIGQLVAVIAAYKDLPGPLKDLIDWDQARQDVQVKYAQVYEQFNVEPLIDSSIQAIPAAPVAGLKSALVVTNLSLSDDSGARLLNQVTTEIRPNETVAVVGSAGSGAEAFAETLGRLAWPDSGGITIDGHDLLDLPESITGRRMSYASADTFFLHGSLRDNLLYGLKHSPLSGAKYEGEEARKFQWHALEARKSGNPVLDLNSDWVDYEAAGARGPEDLLKTIRPVLDAVLISDDLFDLALRSRVDADLHPAIGRHVVELRASLRQRLSQEDLDEIVVPFDVDLYNTQATVGENLLFGTIKSRAGSNWEPSACPYLQQVLRETGLSTSLYNMGLEIAETTVELFHDLPPHHAFFQQLTFMTPDDIPVYQGVLQRLRDIPPEEASPRDRSLMITLSFSYIEPRHRFGLLGPDLMERIVTARKAFHAHMPSDMTGLVERHDPARFSPSASLMDNVLFGRVAYQIADASEQIRKIMKELFCALDLYDDALSISLQFDVGSGGKRLTMAQRQKLNLARALLKRSDYFIFNRPLSALDQRLQDRITRSIIEDLREEGHRPSIIWVLSNPQLAEIFNKVLIFQGGALVGSGDYRNLCETNGIFKELLS